MGAVTLLCTYGLARQVFPEHPGLARAAAAHQAECGASGSRVRTGGAYPTSWWLPGDMVKDRHTLALPARVAAEGRIFVGMYDPATSVRLPAVGADGVRYADDAVLLDSGD